MMWIMKLNVECNLRDCIIYLSVSCSITIHHRFTFSISISPLEIQHEENTSSKLAFVINV